LSVDGLEMFFEKEIQALKAAEPGVAENTVCYVLMSSENGDVIIVRPSGTEPKVKFYFLVSGKDKNETSNKIEIYQKSIKKLI
ncbi:MAG: hypothetical protein IKK94_01880, partial [Clostridia bacterium]|nr:hypothetical protein [Clostridia bacterium]